MINFYSFTENALEATAGSTSSISDIILDLSTKKGDRHLTIKILPNLNDPASSPMHSMVSYWQQGRCYNLTKDQAEKVNKQFAAVYAKDQAKAKAYFNRTIQNFALCYVASDQEQQENNGTYRIIKITQKFRELLEHNPRLIFPAQGHLIDILIKRTDPNDPLSTDYVFSIKDNIAGLFMSREQVETVYKADDLTRAYMRNPDDKALQNQRAAAYQALDNIEAEVYKQLKFNININLENEINAFVERGRQYADQWIEHNDALIEEAFPQQPQGPAHSQVNPFEMFCEAITGPMK